MSIVIKLLILISFVSTQIKPSEGFIDNKPNVWALNNAKIY